MEPRTEPRRGSAGTLESGARGAAAWPLASLATISLQEPPGAALVTKGTSAGAGVVSSERGGAAEAGVSCFVCSLGALRDWGLLTFSLGFFPTTSQTCPSLG